MDRRGHGDRRGRSPPGARPRRQGGPAERHHKRDNNRRSDSAASQRDRRPDRARRLRRRRLAVHGRSRACVGRVGANERVHGRWIGRTTGMARTGVGFQPASVSGPATSETVHVGQRGLEASPGTFTDSRALGSSGCVRAPSRVADSGALGGFRAPGRPGRAFPLPELHTLRPSDHRQPPRPPAPPPLPILLPGGNREGRRAPSGGLHSGSGCGDGIGVVGGGRRTGVWGRS